MLDLDHGIIISKKEYDRMAMYEDGNLNLKFAKYAVDKIIGFTQAYVDQYADISSRLPNMKGISTFMEDLHGRLLDLRNNDLECIYEGILKDNKEVNDANTEG